MMIVTTGFNYAAEPFFFSNADRKDATTIYAKVTLAYTIVAAGASLGVLLYLDVLQYIIAPSYRSGLGIVPVLLLANVCFGLYSNVSVWYKLRDQTRIGAYIALASAALTLVVNIIGIPLYGYMASAVATLVCYAFLAVTTYALGQRYYPVPYSLPRIGGYIALAAILYGVSLAIKAATGTHLATNLAVNTLLLAGFGAVAFFFERRNLRAV